MSVRRILLVAVAALAVAGAWLLGDWAGPVGISASAAAAVVVAVIVGGRTGRRYLHVLAIAAGVVSFAMTAYVLVSDSTIYAPGKNLGGVELFALYALLAAIARWTAPVRLAVASGAVVWAASVVWVLRLVAYSPLAEGGIAFWPISSWTDLLVILGHFAAMAFPATVAVLVGSAPRYFAYRRQELIAAVRREQRLDLAQDLHDFVAHDLTGIVAQAQAARFARGDDLAHLRDALERIEEVGVGALDAMDGFVQVLNADRNTAPRSMQRLSDIPALVERFGEERGFGSPVRVEVEDNLLAGVSQEVQATAYRVVVEGLTNVRRHGEPGCAVTVSATSEPDDHLAIVVTNDSGDAASTLDLRRRARGGTGLATLTERVNAVGGELEAGPDGDRQWRLRAALPRTGRGGQR